MAVVWSLHGIAPKDIQVAPSPLRVGAFSEVYRATYRGEDVAAKSLMEGWAECELQPVTKHPNVVEYKGVVMDGSAPKYLVMELMEGTLAEELEKPLSAERKLSVLIQIAEALTFLHDPQQQDGRTILHRDLKPDNILIGRDGVVKVGDFGLAKLLEQGRVSSGSVVGTPNYQAPELRNGRGATAKSDVFSFGVIILQVDSGSKPDPKPFLRQERGRDVPVPELERRAMDISLAQTLQLRELAMRCLDNDPDKRPEAREILARLKQLAQPPDAERTVSVTVTEPSGSDLRSPLFRTLVTRRFSVDERRKAFAEPRTPSSSPALTPSAQRSPQLKHRDSDETGTVRRRDSAEEENAGPVFAEQNRRRSATLNPLDTSGSSNHTIPKLMKYRKSGPILIDANGRPIRQGDSGDTTPESSRTSRTSTPTSACISRKSEPSSSPRCALIIYEFEEMHCDGTHSLPPTPPAVQAPVDPQQDSPSTKQPPNDRVAAEKQCARPRSRKDPAPHRHPESSQTPPRRDHRGQPEPSAATRYQEPRPVAYRPGMPRRVGASSAHKRTASAV